MYIYTGQYMSSGMHIHKGQYMSSDSRRHEGAVMGMRHPLPACSTFCSPSHHHHRGHRNTPNMATPIIASHGYYPGPSISSFSVNPSFTGSKRPCTCHNVLPPPCTPANRHAQDLPALTSGWPTTVSLPRVAVGASPATASRVLMSSCVVLPGFRACTQQHAAGVECVGILPVIIQGSM